MKKLIISICTLALATALLGASTFAWFSMNKTVDAKNMKVKAKADSSLVISMTNLPTEETDTTTANFNDPSAKMLFAATHDASYTTFTGKDTIPGLKKIKDASSISPATGLKSNGEDFTAADFEVVPETDLNKATDGNYYYDYLVFINALGDSIKNHTIKIEISGGDNIKPINQAISIDFYINTGATNTDLPLIGDLTQYGDADEKNIKTEKGFIGTLNLAGLDAKENNGSRKPSIETNPMNIPKAVKNTSPTIALLMRVYLDGNLKDTGGKAYVRSNAAADISEINLTVVFTAEDASTPS